MKNIVTLSPKFQIVIPKYVRESMQLKAGTKFQVTTYENRIELIPIEKIDKLRGFLQGIETQVNRD